MEIIEFIGVGFFLSLGIIIGYKVRDKFLSNERETVRKHEQKENSDSLILTCGTCGHKNTFIPYCSECGNKL
jgi:hypothetical protein